MGVEGRQIQFDRTSRPAPARRDESGGSKISRLWGLAIEGISSAIRRIPGHKGDILVEAQREERGGREFGSKKMLLAQRLMEKVRERDMFWEADLQHMFAELQRIFDARLGPQDFSNQQCCAIVLALAEHLCTTRELDVLKGTDAAKYLEWAAIHSISDDTQMVSVMLLKKMGEWEAIRNAANSGHDGKGRETAIRVLSC